jgi:hypothetical protein
MKRSFWMAGLKALGKIVEKTEEGQAALSVKI